jgi:hypothetical protein
MIKVDTKGQSPGLAKLSQYSGYVPQFFVLKPDGTVNEALNSGHPRFPYFFASQNIAKLKAIMKAASGS